MPFLTFETNNGQKERTTAIEEKMSNQKSLQDVEKTLSDKLLIMAYFKHTRGLFSVPQTLDRFYYSAAIDTSDRDTDQVVYRYTDPNKKHELSKSSTSGRPDHEQGPLDKHSPSSIEIIEIGGKSQRQEPSMPVSEGSAINSIGSADTKVFNLSNLESSDSIDLSRRSEINNELPSDGESFSSTTKIHSGLARSSGHEGAERKDKADDIATLCQSEDPRIFMVDQLWLWVVDKSMFSMCKVFFSTTSYPKPPFPQSLFLILLLLIIRLETNITCFPQTWNEQADDREPKVFKTISDHLRERQRPPLITVQQLAAVITSLCTSFVDKCRADIMGNQESFLEIFASSISNAVSLVFL